MKRYVISLLTAVMAGAIAFAAESISITATPRYPWNGKVDLKFTIEADETVGGYAAPEPGDDAIAGRRLKYVQSAGDAQLNTGVVPGSKNTIELKFAWEGQPGDNGCLFCARGAALQERTFTGFLIGSKWRFDYNMSAGTESATPTLISGKSVVIRDVAGTASVDGTSVQSFTESSFTVGGPIALFASYVGAPGERVSNYVRAKVYYLKIFGDDGTTLLHDFVPWEKDGVVGMYDMIAKRFVAPNVGTLNGGTKYDTSFTAKDVAGCTNLTMKTLYKSNGTAANPAKESLLPGNYNWVWDAQADLGADTVLERVTVTAETVAPAFTYSVKFNANGGTGTMANEPLAYGIEKALTANAFTRTGYTFQGWATSATGAKVYSDKQSVSNLTTTAGAMVNLYAVWEANTYSVKFNANGGAGTMSNESFIYGTAKALTANAFKRTNYTFQGWATTATGAVKYTDKQSVNNLTTTAGATVNLYAVWKNSNPLYMVIDLSGGSSATSYPVTYLDAVPSGGWTTTYKTTKLVLRYCEAGSFIMGSNQTDESHLVKLTKAFYIGVFEMTQQQWKLICGSCPSSKGDTYPAYCVNYGYWSYKDDTRYATTLIDKINTRTNLKFDFPTEAQWEYACRAGTTTTYYWGNSMNGDYVWYSSNASDGPRPVGGKKSNAWGLYDMCGNVREWVRDWYGALSYGTNPLGASSNTNGYRTKRNGSWLCGATSCTSSARGSQYPSLSVFSNDQFDVGFRLCLTLP